VNAVYVEGIFSSGQAESIGVVSTPVLDDLDIARNGLRLYVPDWPFFTAKEEEGSIRDKLSAVAEFAYAVSAFAQTSVDSGLTVRFNPGIQAGFWFTAEIRTATWLTAYITRVIHSVSTDPEGAMVRSRTQIAFTRGRLAAEPWAAAGMAIPIRYFIRGAS
jgi:hypothetical protein